LIPYQAFSSELVAGIVTLFVILDPVGVLPFFASMTRGVSKQEQAKFARKAVLIAAGLLLVFAFLGDVILLFLGINIADFEVAGGGLLLIFALRDALSNEPLGVKESSATLDSSSMLETMAVIPIATPLLAGPGSLTTVMLLAREPYGLIVSPLAILVDCSVAWFFFRASGRLIKVIGPTGLLIIGKVLDILMAAIAISFLTSGLLKIFTP
jgi:multiple antibiotic resistance protein